MLVDSAQLSIGIEIKPFFFSGTPSLSTSWWQTPRVDILYGRKLITRAQLEDLQSIDYRDEDWHALFILLP